MADVADRLVMERELWGRGVQVVAGVDEAGRGPLAGPVVAAAVILPVGWREGIIPELRGLNDSKQLSPARREAFFEVILSHPDVVRGMGTVSAEVIDTMNILQATHLAMNQALRGLDPAPDHVLVDGRPVKSMEFPQTAVVRGDSKSYSIAAASVLAKVTRDRLMVELDGKYPGYGFAEHKGYGTRAHLEAITRLGPCAIHRRSFAPLRPAERELF